MNRTEITQNLRPRRTCCGAVAVLLALCISGCASTPPIRDASGKPLEESIAELIPLEIGGMEQWLLIRGADRTNPILLWLHGGPGAAQMPLARGGFGAGSRAGTEELEKHFVLVHWDQRGAGKSNPRHFDASTMSVEQYIRDTREVTRYLKERFGREKIILLGHSWGTEVGLHAASRYPEDYHAFIGVSQVVCRRLGEEIAYEHLVQHFSRDRRDGNRRKLEDLGPPPYLEHHRYVRFMKLVDEAGGGLDIPMTSLAWNALGAAEYRPRDYFRWLRGANRGSGPMWHQEAYASFDARRSIPRLQVPAYFFMGTEDYNTPAEAVRLYLGELDAPRGAELVLFEGAAHTPFLHDPEAFVRELLRVRQDVRGETCSGGC